MSYRGHIQNGALVLDDPLCLPEGTEVRIEPVPSSPDSILAVARQVYEGLSPQEIDEIEKIALDRKHFFDCG